MTWSPYQLAIFEHVRQNELRVRSSSPRLSLIVNARAGSGKSTVCHGAIRIAESFGASCAYSMFNSQTVKDFQAKSNDLSCQIKTAHAFGYGVLKKHLGLPFSYKPNTKKVANLLWNHFGSHPQARELIPIAVKLVSFAKDRGVGLPSFPDANNKLTWLDICSHHGITHDSLEDIVALAANGLRASNTQLTEIDFSDMLYLTLLLNLQPERFDYLFIDEAQDTNATRRELFSRMLKPWGCFIIVGDPNQSCYGFNGADPNAMDLLAKRTGAETLPLSVSYRCDKAIIAHAQRWVPTIEAREDAGEGDVQSYNYKALIGAADSLNLDGNTAILCRFNAPNARLTFALLKRGIPCRIEGRDIGYSLIAIVQKFNAETISELHDSLEDWYARELAKASKDDKVPSELIIDKYETLKIIIDQCRNPAEVLTRLRTMFSDANDPETPRNILTLSSIHKAKGREWDRVFLLGRMQYQPSPRARQAWEIEQENNLIYIAVTRARHTLIEITEVPE